MEARKAARTDLWSGLALAGLGAFITAQAWQWDYLGDDGPGAGFFPLWYGIALLVLSLVLAVSSLRVSRAAHPIDWPAARRSLGAWAGFSLALASFPVLGFAVGFGLFSFWMVAVLHRRRARTAALVAVVLAGSFELLFSVALGVPLPTGLLGF